MKCPHLRLGCYRLALIVCIAGLLDAAGPQGIAGLMSVAAANAAPAGAAGTEAAGDGASRAHTIEFGITDLRLRQETALPSIEDPSVALRQDPGCLLFEATVDCPARADLDIAPVTVTHPGSLHRLRRDVSEARDSPGADHLIEEALQRMADPDPD